MSLVKRELDTEDLWERKRQIIEQTPGLSVWRGGETFDDLGGLGNVKSFLRAVLAGVDPPRVIVFIDEIEKAFAGTGTDLSGVKTEMTGTILTYMQDREADGIVLTGPPGAAKSAVAKATGNTAGIPTIAFDLAAMESSLVGASTDRLRTALKIIDAVSQGRMLFIATCNSIASLPPELRRRFTLGTFFFDLPTAEEREIIWQIYLNKYGVSGELPDDEGWTGAEIKECCRKAHRLGMSLAHAARYIVPVSRSAAEQVKALRQMASGKFISASTPGMYQYKETQPAPRRRIMRDLGWAAHRHATLEIRSLNTRCRVKGASCFCSAPQQNRRLNSRHLPRPRRGKLSPHPSGLIHPHSSRRRRNLPERVERRPRRPAGLPYQARLHGLCAACNFDRAFFLYQPGLLDAFHSRARHHAPVHGIHHHRRAPSARLAKVQEEVRMLPV